MDRILTTHTGSLTRAPEVLDFLAAMESGEAYDEAAYEQALATAVADVVRRQVEAGIDVVDDGEMGKASWIVYLYERVRGVEVRLVSLADGSVLPASRDRQAFPEFYAQHDAEVARQFIWQTHRYGHDAEGADAQDAVPRAAVWFCTGPLSYDDTAVRRDIANLEAALEGVDVEGVFMPVVAPASAYWLRNEHYESEEAFVYAVADVLHEEYKCIVDAGFLLQVDDAVLVHEYDSVLANGGTASDYRKWAELRVEALIHALRGIPEERVRYHICNGSWHGPHVYDPPLRDVIDLVLRVPARYYLFEQANPRHEHEWRLWEDVALPDGKVLVPGVVTHHTRVVEHPELVAERLVRLGNLVGRENVMGGTDCGFAQGAFFERVHPSIQWAKLEALAEGARIASRELFGARATT